jgi:hypothetical protein
MTLANDRARQAREATARAHLRRRGRRQVVLRGVTRRRRYSSGAEDGHVELDIARFAQPNTWLEEMLEAVD